MIIKTVKFLFLAVIPLCLFVYLIIPEPVFPAQIPGSLKSVEPADTENTLRQGFYTDLSRQEIIAYFRDHFTTSTLAQIPIATLRFNYPPEESATIIKEQTKSTFLEELAHPGRESLYINGFVAAKDSERMFFGDREYKTKVIIRYIPSNPLVRTLVWILAWYLLVYLVKNILFSLRVKTK
jgi:hypothetical protein